jgi:hypothetical protein
MFNLSLILTLIVIGLFLFTHVIEHDVFFRRKKRYKKRSGKDRRKSFIASKNLMRRSGKDRRENTGKNLKANIDRRIIYISSYNGP